jgi:hypothetical protein
MTDQDWLECTDPTPMLESLRGKVSDRKLRLFACAFCRLLPVPAYYPEKFRIALQRGTQAAEEYADGILNDYQANGVLEETLLATAIGGGSHPLIFAVGRSLWPNAAETAQEIARTVRPVAGACGVLRDIVGNSFRPVTLDPAWLTATLVELAQAIYDDRTFDRLPILADALEEAGCTNAEILNHCRSEGPHVRGCWPVDLMLEKT